MVRKIVKKVSGSKNGNPWFAVILEEHYDATKHEFHAEKMHFIRSEAIFNELNEGESIKML